MAQLLVTESISQIFCELKQLSHVQIEYSSTLFSYQTTSKVLTLFCENLLQQISNRQEEKKHFSTDQGIGLRKIMIQHYQRLYSIMTHESNLVAQTTQDIYQKHKAMENSLTFVDPIVKEIQHKSKVLDKELAQVKQKIEKLQQKKEFQTQSNINIKSRKQEKCFKSEIFLPERKITQMQDIPNKNQSSLLSLFSPRKIDRLETKTQFEQVNTFLQLKLQEVQQYMKIQKQLTNKTIKKIFQIFDETMGSGLEKLETLLLGYIRKNDVNISQSSTHDYEQQEHKVSSDSSSSVDLRCDESLQQVLKGQIDLQKIQFVRKRLYESSQADGGEQISDENQNNYEGWDASPTFKITCPLIIQSVGQINQFNFQPTKNKIDSNESQTTPIDNPTFFLYDSFCKQNVNTLNR